jgi:ribosomal protein S1
MNDETNDREDHDDHANEQGPDRLRAWESFLSRFREREVIKGRVTRTVRGGLLVDIGVDAYLPASQIDTARASDVADYVDQEIECIILKIDESRRHVVIRRRVAGGGNAEPSTECGAPR